MTGMAFPPDVDLDKTRPLFPRVGAVTLQRVRGAHATGGTAIMAALPATCLTSACRRALS
ncbi:MAG: hypothetical protein FJZ47_17555 [Candidatus Tectomicrobia bacterium]|uniref:Uncharacterized protein n=1 Tax=Tectimicrobiota bacterium TaxID=2528274 RepID=A0A938B3Q3_UNCTE|nr:hypothetical protein [Candidatus Tectomicrobia bacterium]